ncbi:MAG: ATP-binding protein [Planctomycetota bacterium]
MKAPSLRWRLSLTTTALATAIAALLAGVVHAHTRDHLTDELERSLEEKYDETVTLLTSRHGESGVDTFLRAETSYRDSPYEYFFQILDGAGAPVARSQNLDGFGLQVLLPDDARAPRMDIVVHPRDATRRLLSRSERLPGPVQLRGHGDLVAQVAVTLEPLDESLWRNLVQLCGWTAAGVAFLFGALWFSVGSSLRRVSEISRRAATITDLSLRERLPVHTSGDELAELSAVLNTMLDGLERSWVQMESFTSDAAHQLRTPLTRMRGELDLLLQRGSRLSEQERTHLEGVRDEVQRLTRTCGRLLLLARLDQGALEQELLRDHVDVGQVASDLVEEIGPLAREKGVRIQCESTSASTIRCSQPLLTEALLNLLHNAVRFTPTGGCISVTIRDDTTHTAVVVSDTGPGIPDEMREAVFQRFFRLRSNSRSGDDGAGLGLAIVRGISRAHGGDVVVEANAPHGARLVLTLPKRG